MSLKTANVDDEFKKNKDLKREDVKTLKEWVERQPHLPPITELQLILFLHSCYYSVELSKSTIDTFFTIRTHCPEFFAHRDLAFPAVKDTIDVSLSQPLPKLTHENYGVILYRVIDGDISKYSYTEQFKLFDMSQMLWLTQEGTKEGLIIVFDMHLITLSHFLKLNIMSTKKYLYYLQDAMPVRLKGLHFINVVPFMDKILALIKPFMKKELLDVLHLHTESIDSLFQFVPKECMPSDYGGAASSISEFHETMKSKLKENAEFFLAENKQIVDESKRPDKPKNAGDIFGIEGSFKKLDID